MAPTRSSTATNNVALTPSNKILNEILPLGITFVAEHPLPLQNIMEWWHWSSGTQVSHMTPKKQQNLSHDPSHMTPEDSFKVKQSISVYVWVSCCLLLLCCCFIVGLVTQLEFLKRKAAFCD